LANGPTGEAEPWITGVELTCPPATHDSLRHFYIDTLGFPATSPGGDRFVLGVGGAELAFVAADEAAFYHFALLVPPTRFDAAREWATVRVKLLSGAGGDATFTFPAWNARAFYFHDPAGNIVELIAHDFGDQTHDEFSADELEAISEVGLVVSRPAEAAGLLEREAGLELWSGGVKGPEALGFVGRQAHTLIVVPTGRGWLPTGRAAKPHPVAVTVAGPGLPRVTLTVEAHTVSTRPQ
jgi:catechol 2,3-dioxygenase-like lactoylglutathione lyase family enzyme